MRDTSKFLSIEGSFQKFVYVLAHSFLSLILFEKNLRKCILKKLIFETDML